MSKPLGSAVLYADARSVIVDRCLDGWGPELLGYLLGAGLDGELARWRLSDALKNERVLARLEAVHDLLLVFNDSRSARAWVRNINPELPSCSPATVIRHGTDDALQDVRTLAEAYEPKL